LRASASAVTICYCRVCSPKQKDDLARQVAFMQKRFPGAEVVEDRGSGLDFKRKGLRTLLDRALRGEKLRLVVAHKDRLARFGFDPGFNPGHVIASADGEIVVLNDVRASPDPGFNPGELVEDLVAIVHVFSCRLNGRRTDKGKSQSSLSDHRSTAIVQELDLLRTVCLQPDGGVP